jgi:hypothetical protein
VLGAFCAFLMHPERPFEEAEPSVLSGGHPAPAE